MTNIARPKCGFTDVFMREVSKNLGAAPDN